jgi:hypothetical protein
MVQWCLFPSRWNNLRPVGENVQILLGSMDVHDSTCLVPDWEYRGRRRT